MNTQKSVVTKSFSNFQKLTSETENKMFIFHHCDRPICKSDFFFKKYTSV